MITGLKVLIIKFGLFDPFFRILFKTF